MVKGINKGFFVSQRKDEVLVFSSRSLKAIVLSEAEYLVFTALINSSNKLDDSKLELAKIFSSKLNLQLKDCLVWVNSLEKTLISSGILNKSNKSRNHKLEIEYPEKPFKPVAIYLHLTNACNLKCLYCYNSNYRNNVIKDKLRELDDSEILDIIDQAVELGITSFSITGGEPLLSPFCLKFGEYITKNKKCYAELLTNGTLIEKSDIEELLNSYTKIVISLDSHIPEKHNAMRGEGTFEIVMRGIKKICEIDPSRVVLRPVFHKLNINDFEEYVKYAYDKFGIRQVRSSLCTPTNHNKARNSKFLIGPEEYLNMLQTHEKIVSESRMELETEDLCVNKGCGAGSSILSIGACGEVFACQAMHSDDLLAGNTRKATLKQIGETSPILKSIKNLNPNKIDGCRDCCLISICGGGCRANAHTIFGSIYSKNILQCPLDIKKCEFLLWKEADKIKTKTQGQVQR
jgi:radical SAM protein with 4Fe4S-binding SPASM domain